MGVIVQPLPNREADRVESSLLPLHMRGLFYEFLKRYEEWQSLRRKELGWLTGVVSLGLASLVSFARIAFLSKWVSFILLCFFIYTIHYYFKIRKKVAHVFVNVHILQHHLLGKLEVGFCQHDGLCQCAENFRKYVWKKYHISLYP